MSLKVIELNDKAISVGDESGVLLRSPGFALADGQDLVLGELAEQQARLQPTNSYNKYWHELNLDPIEHGNNFRHHADIAFAHLQHLAEEADIASDVVIAVPGSFTRQQLSILLGLSQHSPFKVSGVVDSAVAAAIVSARASNVLYADLQLHQVVVTRLTTDGSQLSSGSTVQIPGVGSQNFTDLMMQLATGMFIQQCRFNPQHDAESEQQLYNQLPAWLAQAQQDGNLILELNAGDTVHTAKMPMESLITNLNSHFKKINEQVTAMATDHDTQLIVSPALAELPGFRASLPASLDLIVIDEGTVNDACLEYRELITGGEQGISLVNSLPVSQHVSSNVKSADQSAEQPTHVLHGNQAISVKQISIRNQQTLNGHGNTAGVLTLSIANLPEDLGAIADRGDGVYFNSGDMPFLLNGVTASGERKLAVGDRIQFEGSNEVLTLIQVQNV
ncbi:MAG: hypothetical protein MI746_00960 [Pseudomonadales bacterium]|nr:hypothetical protein [Pseudomonadales bacterium]